MDGNTKVVFMISIGYQGAYHKEIFTLDELGYDSSVDTDIEKFLEECWKEWSTNYIDGGFRIVE